MIYIEVVVEDNTRRMCDLLIVGLEIICVYHLLVPPYISTKQSNKINNSTTQTLDFVISVLSRY
jgi:hypothetical protein